MAADDRPDPVGYGIEYVFPDENGDQLQRAKRALRCVGSLGVPRGADVDLAAARERRAHTLRSELHKRYGLPLADIAHLPLAALFELRWKLLQR